MDYIDEKEKIEKELKEIAALERILEKGQKRFRQNEGRTRLDGSSDKHRLDSSQTRKPQTPQTHKTLSPQTHKPQTHLEEDVDLSSSWMPLQTLNEPSFQRTERIQSPMQSSYRRSLDVDTASVSLSWKHSPTLSYVDGNVNSDVAGSTRNSFQKSPSSVLKTQALLNEYQKIAFQQKEQLDAQQIAHERLLHSTIQEIENNRNHVENNFGQVLSKQHERLIDTQEIMEFYKDKVVEAEELLAREREEFTIELQRQKERLMQQIPKLAREEAIQILTGQGLDDPYDLLRGKMSKLNQKEVDNLKVLWEDLKNEKKAFAKKVHEKEMYLSLLQDETAKKYQELKSQGEESIAEMKRKMEKDLSERRGELEKEFEKKTTVLQQKIKQLNEDREMFNDQIKQWELQTKERERINQLNETKKKDSLLEKATNTDFEMKTESEIHNVYSKQLHEQKEMYELNIQQLKVKLSELETKLQLFHNENEKLSLEKNELSKVITEGKNQQTENTITQRPITQSRSLSTQTVSTVSCSFAQTDQIIDIAQRDQIIEESSEPLNQLQQENQNLHEEIKRLQLLVDGTKSNEAESIVEVSLQPPKMLDMQQKNKVSLPKLKVRVPALQTKEIFWRPLPRELIIPSVWIKRRIATRSENLDIPTDRIEAMFAQEEVHSSITYLDKQRHQMLSIFLENFHLSNKEIYDSILSLDESRLTRKQIQKLFVQIPSPPEIEELEYDGNEELLGIPDQFVKYMSKIPHLAQRLKAWIFKLQFDSLTVDIKTDINHLSKGIAQLKSNESWFDVLQLCLAIGNYLNGHHNHKIIHGFPLKYLERFAMTESTNGKGPKMTMIQFLASHISSKLPHLRDWDEEFQDLRIANEVSFQLLQDDVQKLDSGIERIKKEIQFVEIHAGDVKDRFVFVMKPFIDKVLGVQMEIHDNYQALNDEIASVCELYGEKDISALMQNISKFMNLYNQAKNRVPKPGKRKFSFFGR